MSLWKNLIQIQMYTILYNMPMVKEKKKQYELVNFCIFSSKYRQILKAVLFLY